MSLRTSCYMLCRVNGGGDAHKTRSPLTTLGGGGLMCPDWLIFLWQNIKFMNFSPTSYYPLHLEQLKWWKSEFHVTRTLDWVEGCPRAWCPVGQGVSQLLLAPRARGRSVTLNYVRWQDNEGYPLLLLLPSLLLIHLRTLLIHSVPPLRPRRSPMSLYLPLQRIPITHTWTGEKNRGERDGNNVHTVKRRRDMIDCMSGKCNLNFFLSSPVLS